MPLGKRELVARVADAVGLARLVLHLRARRLLPTSHVTILTYHRIVRSGGLSFERRDLHVTPETLDRQVGILKRFFTLIDTRQLDAHLQGAPLPPNPALVTFDDGYRDNHDEALPVLQRHGVRATFFIATRYVTEQRMFWWDHLRYIVGRAAPGRFALSYPDSMTLDLTGESQRAEATEQLLGIVKSRAGLDLDRFLDETARGCGVRPDPDEEKRLAHALVMSWDQVRSLHEAGMDVQSHGWSHRVLTTLREDEAEADLGAARQELEERLGKPVFAVAYPVGRAPAQDGPLRRAGYRLGFTSGTGVARTDRPIDPFRLPRLSVDRLYVTPFFRGVLAFAALGFQLGNRPAARSVADPLSKG